MRSIENKILAELLASGGTTQAALAIKLGEKSIVIVKALMALKIQGLVVFGTRNKPVRLRVDALLDEARTAVRDLARAV